MYSELLPLLPLPFFNRISEPENAYAYAQAVTIVSLPDGELPSGGEIAPFIPFKMLVH